jgi:hypothetical protein
MGKRVPEPIPGTGYFTAGPVDMSLIFDIKLICLKHFPEKLAIDCDA